MPAEHSPFAQLIIMVCLYVAAHADGWTGQILAVAPAIAAPAAVVLAFVRSAPGLWMCQALWGVLVTVIKALLAAYQARQKG